MRSVTLYDVIDIRTGKYHSVARVKTRDEKWFVKAEEEAETADTENI